MFRGNLPVKWANLRKNKCPKCDKAFGYQAFSEPNFVNCPHCDFKISHKRYTEIVNSQVNAEIEEKYVDPDEEDAQAEGNDDN